MHCQAQCGHQRVQSEHHRAQFECHQVQLGVTRFVFVSPGSVWASLGTVWCHRAWVGVTGLGLGVTRTVWCHRVWFGVTGYGSVSPPAFSTGHTAGPSPPHANTPYCVPPALPTPCASWHSAAAVPPTHDPTIRPLPAHTNRSPHCSPRFSNVPSPVPSSRPVELRIAPGVPARAGLSPGDGGTHRAGGLQPSHGLRPWHSSHPMRPWSPLGIVYTRCRHRAPAVLLCGVERCGAQPGAAEQTPLCGTGWGN